MSRTDRLRAVHTLDVIDLEELSAIADLQVREDRKYLVPGWYVESLVARLDARVLQVDGTRTFRYESVYFDTSELASYLGAARRRPRRFKVRTRSYLDSGDCMLEVKTRDARGRTVKHRHPYDLDERGELTAEGRAFVREFEPAAMSADLLAPSLITAYQRATLVPAGGPARLTVDMEIGFRRPDGPHVDLNGVALIETKTPGKPCPADRVLWRDGHRPTTISKYCTGLAAIVPDLPANKWNRVLRRYFRQAAVTEHGDT